MARYIDESEIKFTGHTFTDANNEVYVKVEDVRKAIAQTPTADVVEVCRCKKCKYGDVSTISKTIDGEEYTGCYCKLKNAVMDVEHYCSYGVKK